MEVTGIKCPSCKQKIWSEFRHDFHYCKCGYCHIDGGRDYLKYGWGAEGGVALYGQPEVITMKVRKKKVQK